MTRAQADGESMLGTVALCDALHSVRVRGRCTLSISHDMNHD